MLLLFVIAIFSGAGLLFLVQPMIAKQLLPLLGGSPSVWNTCMVFFQLTLLGGYLYAHLLGTLRRRRTQMIVQGAVVLAALLTLPIGLGGGEGPVAGGSPNAWLLWALATSVGGPFFVLASASPLLQKWFAGTGHRRASDPYFLYAAGNAGSMIALLSYPFVVEPELTLPGQLRGWSWGFSGFALLALACVWISSRHASPADPQAEKEPSGGTPVAISVATRVRWIALAFVPSSLLLGVTQHISTDIATTPILWIVPLVLYLLTFIIAFGGGSGFVAIAADRLVPLVVVSIGGLMIAGFTTPIWPQITLHLAGLLIIGVACHGRLAAERPDTRRLTEFYLLMSVGGALGGAFNAFVAPMLFGGIAEYPIVLVLACLLRRPRRDENGGPTRRRIAVRSIDAIAGVTLVLALYFARAEFAAFLDPPNFLGIDGRRLAHGLIPACGCLLMLPRRWPFVLALTTMFGCTQLLWTDTIVYSERTFFGVHRVTEQKDGSGHWRHLWHGSTAHGSQDDQPPWSRYATRYYAKNGPAGNLMDLLLESDAAQHIALVGLGVGTLATYGRFDWRMTYYEIDPEIVRIARDPRLYTYCKDSAAKLDFVVGDARLRLSGATDKYHAIFLDAFSSDAIPVHLITKNAVELYLDRLQPGGFLAFHTTNWHLDLLPVLGNIAADLNLVAAVRRDGDISTEDVRLTRKEKSVWVVLARDKESLGTLSVDENWPRLPPDRTRRTWTDDYSNVLEILRW